MQVEIKVENGSFNFFLVVILHVDNLINFKNLIASQNQIHNFFKQKFKQKKMKQISNNNNKKN